MRNKCYIPEVTLIREYGYKTDPLGTIGQLFLGNKFLCYTLERPWENNRPFYSCIPEGDYEVRFTESKKFKRRTFELQDVPDRSAIRIHPANFVKELSGCIAPASFVFEEDCGYKAADSRKTLNMIESILPRFFILSIKLEEIK